MRGMHQAVDGLVEGAVAAEADEGIEVRRAVFGKGLGVAEVGVKEHLGQALAVAQVDEDEPAKVAAAPDPARERDDLADVRGAQLAAGMRVK